MALKTKKELLFAILSGVFITNAITAELISCKFVSFFPFPVIAGIIPWPIVFLTTDILNEYFGKESVKKLSYITVFLILLCFGVVYTAINLKAVEGSPVDDATFEKVFGGSLLVMIGSIIAFFVSQLIDIWAFWFMRKLTGGKMIWLRATGSTVISQLVDSYTVLLIGFLLPGKISIHQFFDWGIKGYLTKLFIAIALTPFIYLLHKVIDKYLGEKESEKLIHHTAEESLQHKTND